MRKKMNEYKNLEYGYIILSPDGNPKHVEITVKSIRRICDEAKIVCVIQDGIARENEDEIAQTCDVLRGEGTYTSLISKGMQNPTSEWNIIVISGNIVTKRIQEKYSYFTESERDILFPVVDRKWNFVDGTINGIMFHRNAKSEIGDFPRLDSLQECKIAWASSAIEMGYKFKAIVGARLS